MLETVVGLRLHHGETEYKGDGEPFSNHIIALTESPRETHDESHIKRHKNTGNPERLLSTPGIDIVQTD
jgi:hypothetical protein